MFRARLASFRYALQGLADLFRTQANARIHAAAAGLVVALGLWLGIDGRDWAVLVLAMGAVLAAEAFNTALECLVDLVSPGHHPLAGRAKDLAAGAVLLTALAALVVGLLVLGPPLWARLVV